MDAYNMTAEERAAVIALAVGVETSPEFQSLVRDQISAAEQAMKERAAQVAESCGEPCCECIDAIRALAQ